ncbi:MAG: hypothetical protein DRI30_07175 [Chloroflexi bacterium]|nr:MAG: hypothetical protein DRI30_07175 [Chloroflexota bacterium]
MSVFECLSVALALVLGLAITLILTALLAAFRARGETRMDALPFAWAILVLVYQFDFWWEVYGLSALPTWSVLTFGLLLLLALLLFLAGGLVLPTGRAEYPADLGDYFRRDGRWGVATLAAYNLVGSITNVVLFGFAVLSLVNILNAAGMGLIAVVVLSSRRRVQWVCTLLFAVVIGTTLVLFAPSSY